MSAASKPTPIPAKQPDDTPQFFRLNVEVGDLDKAAAFYSALLGVEGLSLIHI